MANAIRYIQVAYYLICLPFGVLLNLFVTVTILHNKKLQNVTFALALQVCAGDMIDAAIVFPTSAASAIADRFVFIGFCTTIGFAVFFLRLVRIYLMLVLVLDRFCSVFMPFWYQRNKIKVIAPLSVGAWSWGFVVAIIPVRGILDCYSFQRTIWICVPNIGCRNENTCSAYSSILIALSHICNIAGIILYSILFYKAKKLRNKIAIAPQSNIENANEGDPTADKLKRERRANITFLVLFLALVGVNIIPFAFVAVGRPVITTLKVVPHPAYIVAGIIGRDLYPLLTIVDPIVVMRNEDFKEAIQKMLNWVKKASGNDRSSNANATITTTQDTVG